MSLWIIIKHRSYGCRQRSMIFRRISIRSSRFLLNSAHLAMCADDSKSITLSKTTSGELWRNVLSRDGIEIPRDDRALVTLATRWTDTRTGTMHSVGYFGMWFSSSLPPRSIHKADSRTLLPHWSTCFVNFPDPIDSTANRQFAFTLRRFCI